jgi:hypothetical protein
MILRFFLLGGCLPVDEDYFNLMLGVLKIKIRIDIKLNFLI